MYQDLRNRIQALKEEAEVEATATSMARDAADFVEVEDEHKDEEVLEAVFYEDGEEDEVATDDLPEGEETVVEDGDEDEGEEESPFDRDDVEVAEAPKFGYQKSGKEDIKDKPGTFDYVAKKILRKQKKLGAIKGITVKVLSLSESRKKRMKELGILAGAYIAASVVGAVSSGKSQAELARAYGMSDKDARKQGAKVGLAAAGGGVAGAAAGAGASYALQRKYKTVLVEVTYKYGKKVFSVFNVTEEQERSGLPKFIFNSIKSSIEKFKSKKNWVVKEAPTMNLLKNQQLASALTEAYLFEDDEAEDQPAEVVDPDQEIHDQEVTESTIGIFIEDADLDDEELDSDVPVDEDEDEELPVPGADSAEDEEELSETYFF